MAGNGEQLDDRSALLSAEQTDGPRSTLVQVALLNKATYGQFTLRLQQLDERLRRLTGTRRPPDAT